MFRGHCSPKSVILQAEYFKLRFSHSYRDVEELMSKQGIKVDHATIQRWVFKFTPSIDRSFRKRMRTIGLSWRMDETYIKVKGEWKYLYRAVDKAGKTVDFLLTNRRNQRAAHLFLIKAITQHATPTTINIDKSGANKQAIKVYNKRNLKKIKCRQCKYLNNTVEQDHRFVKKRTQPMLGFKSFESAQRTLTGIEVIRMLKKDQLKSPKSSTIKSFFSLVA